MGFALNSVSITGRLTRDPEVRNTPSGLAITNVSIAYNERRKNQQSGDYEDVAHYFDGVIFGGQGDWLSKNAAKGDEISVGGQLAQRRWEAQDGSKRSAVEIIVRDLSLGREARSGGQGGGGRRQGGGEYATADDVQSVLGGTRYGAGGDPGPSDEDIPFAPSAI